MQKENVIYLKRGHEEQIRVRKLRAGASHTKLNLSRRQRTTTGWKTREERGQEAAMEPRQPALEINLLHQNLTSPKLFSYLYITGLLSHDNLFASVTPLRIS